MGSSDVLQAQHRRKSPSQHIHICTAASHVGTVNLSREGVTWNVSLSHILSVAALQPTLLSTSQIHNNVYDEKLDPHNVMDSVIVLNVVLFK